MKNYIISDLALADLEDIADYFLEVRPEYLDLLQAELESKFHFVGRYPKIGTPSDHLLTGLRRVVVREYNVYYREIAGRTEVSRIVHGSRDIDATYFDGSDTPGTPP